MNFLAKMERKFGKYAIRNLPLIITICYGFGYLMNMIKPEWIYTVSLNPYAIMHGQVWRLITWVLVPEEMSIFFVLIMLYIYYSLGRTLERTWGTFYFNVYFFSGLILTVAGAFLLYGYFSLFGEEFIDTINSGYEMLYGACPEIYGGNWAYEIIANRFGTYYLNLSIFLATAIMYPEMMVYVFFILPIKIKVMGIIYVIILAVNILMSFLSGFDIGMISLVSIGMSLLNTFIFFLMTRKGTHRTPKQVKRQVEYKVKVKQAKKASSHHKCTICGQTDESNPQLVFRYCSKCSGSHEYCNEHLYTHEHIK